MGCALLFAPDGYVLEGHQIMGRRAAGAALLRALVEHGGKQPLVGYGRNRHATAFDAAVKAYHPDATTSWIAPGQFDRLGKAGNLYTPGPTLGAEARLRLRAGPMRYSLCGITHTLSTARALEAVGALLTEPVMPWDALICTSSVALKVVRDMLDAAHEQLCWRLGTELPTPRLPQLPVIPLGVHSSDWTPSEARRSQARSRLGIKDDEVVLLFAGRLSLAGKAHPFQMLDALRQVSAGSDRPLVLVLAGQYFNAQIERAFTEAAARHCPAVRTIHADGADGGLYEASYAAADIFLSLADSTQETFGITPVEAMAAGLPAIVSDWNGYRDTVRDGLDGFRIRSWAPADGSGARIALAHEVDSDFELYSSRTTTTVSIDMSALVDRLSLLVADPALRRHMGAAARQRAVADYDWGVILGRYRELWEELDARRAASAGDSAIAAWLAQAPSAHAVHVDPFGRFASYPTALVSGTTLAQATPGASRAGFEALVAEPLFMMWRMPAPVAEAIIMAAAEPATVTEIAYRIGQEVSLTIELVARLAKMNLLVLESDPAG